MKEIIKACELLAQRQFENSNGIMFTDNIISGPKLTPLDTEMAVLFMQNNHQYSFTPSGSDFKIELAKACVFQNERGENQLYCESCGYDQFEVMTVLRRECTLWECGITAIKNLSKDHLTTCLCCGRKVHMEFSS
jgi:hypothetical protein